MSTVVMTLPAPTRCGLTEEPFFLVGGDEPARLGGDGDARGFTTADVSDQLREDGDGFEVVDDRDLQPALVDRRIERGPLLGDRDLLTYVLRHHELVVRDLALVLERLCPAPSRRLELRAR